MTFEHAQSYLLGTINETISRRVPNRLDRMRALLAALGNPQDRYPTVHVGGTSGKGSTSTMIATAFVAAGKRTGLHTKPHLRSVVERAVIDGLPIGEERFADILSEMMPSIERVAQDHGRATYYETLLAIAFLYFAQEQVDVAVIEVGLGGKLDGTNVLVPQVSIITNSSLDHTDVLGDSVALIAADEAGIARPGVPLVSDVNDPEARAAIEAGCREARAPFFSVRDEVRIEERAGERYGQSFIVVTPADRYEITLPVLGRFQQRNAATAIRALELLGPALRPARAEIEAGLARLVMPGRMEFHPAHPSVIFDIAHNGDKARNLCDALLETFPNRRFAFVLAASESKDAGAILEPFARLPGTFIFTSFEAAGRTAMRPQRLASQAEEFGMWGRAIADPIDAFAVARRSSDANDVVVVTGSTFVVATLREWWYANVSTNV
jgi:dihydrofolate synthase/folylpolyglutamate synthase